MKKLIAIVLTAVTLLSLAACGYINEKEVSVLWSGNGKVESPSTLINAVERAMYIESISYKHYGAEGDAAKQLKQAQDALKAGSAALVVELAEGGDAQAFVDLAKEKNVPLVFFNCDVLDSVVAGYDKCVLLGADADSACKMQAEQVIDAVTKAKGDGKVADPDKIKKLDTNGDGKINYLCVGETTRVEIQIDALKETYGITELVEVRGDVAKLKAESYKKTEKTLGIFENTTECGRLLTAAGDVVEMIVTLDDVLALETLVAVQALGFNTTKLATHFVPIYTTGRSVDYKSVVMLTMPEAPVAFEKWATAEAQEKLSEKDTEKLNKWWDGDKAVAKWKSDNANLCSLASVGWKDLGTYLYTTVEVIGAGKLSGSAIADLDAMAVTLAAAVRNLIKGEAVTKGIDETYVKGEQKILVPYTTA